MKSIIQKNGDPAEIESRLLPAITTETIMLITIPSLVNPLARGFWLILSSDQFRFPNYGVGQELNTCRQHQAQDDGRHNSHLNFI